MKRITTKLRSLKLSPAAKNVLLIVTSFLIIDVLVAVLGASYLSRNTGAFLGKSRTVILSDLLFLEGAITLAIGTFIAVARAWQEREQTSEPTTETNDDAEQTRGERVNIGVLLIIIGAIMIGLSITVGTLL